MKTHKWFGAAAGATLAGLWIAACGGDAPAPPAALGFDESFDQASCRFGSVEGSTSKGYGCVDGGFRAWIDNDASSYDFIAASAGEKLGDVQIEVDVRFTDGAEAGAYLLCRGSQAEGNFYLFRLSADGFVEITDFLEGEEQIARGKALPAGVLQPGWNKMRAECVGQDLTLFVNGEQVLERVMEGPVSGPGDIGLGAGGASEGLSDVFFDNLVVSPR